MSVIRVLIVEDSREWRELISYLLVKDRRIQIVGEAQDGAQGLELATQTRPTLILLDFCMPVLNGLDAARQILALEPKTRVIFVTGESDHEVARAAFEIGASGYVLKARANSDLLLAIDAAINGTRFVSDGLFTDISESAEDDGGNRYRKAANTSTRPIEFVAHTTERRRDAYDC